MAACISAKKAALYCQAFKKRTPRKSAASCIIPAKLQFCG